MTIAASAADVSRARRTWALPWLPWVCAWCVLTPLAAATFSDPDLWGHLRFGLDALAHHRLETIDPYSFTQDVPWVNHEWLSEAVLAVAYRLGGNIGLVVLKATLVLATYAVVASALTGAWAGIAVPLLLLFGVATLPLTVTLRPQLWTFLGTAVLCRVLRAGPSRWWLVGLPVLFLLWANLHGGWLVGAGILVMWTGAQFVKRQAPRALIGAASVLSAVGTLVNPYGWRLWDFLARTVRPARDITEWQPLSTSPIGLWGPYLLMLLFVGALAATRHRPKWDALLVMLILGLGALRVTRLAALWATASVVFVGPTLASLSAMVPPRWWTIRVPSVAAARVMLVPIACAALAAAMETARVGSCILIDGEWVPDLLAARAVADARPSGRLVTAFEWGEFAIWHFGPSLRVSLDGRRETVYSDAVLAKHLDLYEASATGIEYFRQLNPGYVWLPASRTRLRDWLSAHGYRLDVQTSRSFVAVRADLPIVSEPAPADAAPCFPGL